MLPLPLHYNTFFFFFQVLKGVYALNSLLTILEMCGIVYFFTFGKKIHSFSDAMREIKLDYVTINHGAVHFSVRSFAAHFFNVRMTLLSPNKFETQKGLPIRRTFSLYL